MHLVYVTPPPYDTYLYPKAFVGGIASFSSRFSKLNGLCSVVSYSVMGCPFLNQIVNTFLQLLQFGKILFEGEWPELYIGLWGKFWLYRVFMLEM